MKDRKEDEKLYFLCLCGAKRICPVGLLHYLDFLVSVFSLLESISVYRKLKHEVNTLFRGIVYEITVIINKQQPCHLRNSHFPLLGLKA